MRSVILIVMCALTVGFQSDNQAQKNKTHKSKDGKQVSIPASSSQTSRENADSGRGAEDKKQDNKVTVVAVPEVRIDQRKNVIDWLMLVFTAALAVTAVFGTCYALKTLRVLRHEARIAVAALKQTGKLANAADEMFRLTHRPKLIIRNVVIHGMAKLNSQTPMTEQSTVLNGYYTVANVGGLPAILKKRKEGTWCDNKGLPMERPDRENPGKICNDVIAPGESTEFSFHDMVLSTEDAVDLVLQKTTAYFLVQIEYTDEAGIKRQTSACRKFFQDIKRFGRIEDPDYEYAD
jgi:hypothetical protein